MAARTFAVLVQHVAHVTIDEDRMPEAFAERLAQDLAAAWVTQGVLTTLVSHTGLAFGVRAGPAQTEIMDT
jgi:hypothetical protein